MEKIKILWSSVSPMVQSGYGRVTREVVKRLVDRGYDVMCHGYQTMGQLHDVDGKYKMLDFGGAPDYGAAALKKYFKIYERDVLITLYDIWAFFGKYETLDVPWVPYFPIDAAPVTTPIIEPLKYAYKRITMSQFGKDECDKVGLGSTIIYHGVDTKVYKPESAEEKKAMREKLGIPLNTFMVGTNGANQWDRKDFPRMVRIFAEFVKKYDAKDALLYLHANPDGLEGKAYSLKELAKLYGILDQVRFCEGKNTLLDTGLVKMYNTFDVYLSTSRGEGCGLPILEAQACGVPAIVAENSAQPEWVRGHGWVVPCSDHIVVLTTPLHNKWMLIDVDAAVEALGDAYINKEKRLEYGKAAQEAMKAYDWDKIVDEQWVPFLEGLAREKEAGTTRVNMGAKDWNIRTTAIDRAVLFEVLVNKTYEQHIDIAKDDVWLDIGGHIGTFSIDIANRVDHVYTYEPVKENFAMLNGNIALNNIENIDTFNRAIVGNDDTSREFYLDGSHNTGGHSLIGAQNATKIEVDCVNINRVLHTLKPNKIKLDCEGAEYEILMNMDFTGIDQIVFEYHFNLLGLTKYEELIAHLRKTFKTAGGPHVINVSGQTIAYAKR
jgi:FkbM family methyltransferase